MLTRALVSPALVGRTEELRELVKLRLAAARGHGALVLVSGEAGIGKTRLLQSFATTLSGGRAKLGVGYCREFVTSPFGAIRETLMSLGAANDVQPAETREAQLTQYAERIAEACRRHIVIMLEDIQWADDASLALLRHLLPKLVSMRLLLIATYRSDEASRSALLEPYIAKLLRERATHHIALSPLANDDIRHLLKLAAGTRTLAARQVEDIVDRCDGNAFFAEELLKNALEGGTKGLPFTVRATVLDRLTGLEPVARETLLLASVLGRRFDATFLARICGMDLKELLTILRRLRTLQLIDEIEEHPNAYAFRHALTREAVYGELLSAELRILHGRILEVFESTGTGNSDDLGYHAWAAGDRSSAVRYNEAAGDGAREMHAYRAAVTSYERAIDFTAAPQDRARLLVKAARCYAMDGKSKQAVQLYETALEAKGWDREALLRIYQEMGAQARLGGDYERAIAILEDARQMLDDDASRDAAVLSIGLAYLRLDRGELEAAKELVARSDAAAGTLPYSNVFPYLALVAGDASTWRKSIAPTLALSETAGAEHAARARFNFAFGLTILGFDAEACESFEQLLPELTRLSLRSLEVLACANHALLHARSGRLGEARELIERAIAMPEPSTTGPIALAAAALVVAQASREDDLVARACSRAIVEDAFRSRINSALGRIAGPYARWLHAHGDAPGARDILHRAMLELNSACGATESFLVAAELGDSATQARAFEHIAEIASMRAPIYVATEAHLRALLALRQAQFRETEMFATSALMHYRELGWVMHQVRCLELIGERKRAAAMSRRIAAPGVLSEIRSTGYDERLNGILSKRQREVAIRVANGTTNKLIAVELEISERTVEKYLTSVYDKLGLRNRSELAAYVAGGKRFAR